jgi:hypothetical protein
MEKSVLAGLVLSIMALLPQASSFAADSKDCGLKRYAAIDLVAGRNGYLLVPVTIESTRAYMVLNMGGPFSMLTETAANSLSLKASSMPNGFQVRADGRPIQKIVVATPFMLGDLKFRSANFLVVANERFTADQADAPLVGFLGMDVFNQFDIELDIAHRKMNLFSQDHCKGHAVYWSAKYDAVPIRSGSVGEFYFPMELEGKKLETTLATSNKVTTLHTDATRQLFNFDNHSPDVQTETDEAGRSISQYRAMKLSGEGIEVINARISLIDSPPNTPCHLSSHLGAASYEGCFGMHPLALGQNVLSKLHLYIATKEKMLYFTPAEPSAQSGVAAAPTN